MISHSYVSLPGVYVFELMEENNGPECAATDTVVITFYQVPTSDFSVSNIACYNDTAIVQYLGNASDAANYSWDFDGAVVVSGTGQGPYLLRWSSPGVRELSLSVTENGCFSDETDETTLNPEELVSVITVVDDPCFESCDGVASVETEGGTAPYSYSWGPNPYVSDQCMGSYNLIVTDNNGCTWSDNYIINQPPQIVINSWSVDDVTCFGLSNGEVSVQASGGTGSLTYQWSNGHSGSTINNVQAGNYNLTITDANGCSLVSEYTVQQPAGESASSAVDRAKCRELSAILISMKPLVH